MARPTGSTNSFVRSEEFRMSLSEFTAHSAALEKRAGLTIPELNVARAMRGGGDKILTIASHLGQTPATIRKALGLSEDAR